MEKLSDVSNTLFVPLLGRISISEKHPNVLYDQKALEFKNKIPSECFKGNQKEYSLIASASRSFNMDKYVEEFIEYNKEPVIVELGIGLETSYYRCKRKPFKWYGLDLADVIRFRQKVLGNEKDIELIKFSMFDEEWMDKVRCMVKHRPILFIASGVFQYFSYDEVIKLLSKLQEKFHHSFIAFDCLSKAGFNRVGKYMKQAGHEEVKMQFYLDDADDIVKDLQPHASLIEEKDMYHDIPKKHLKLTTRLTMAGSDLAHMVKMVYIKL